MKLRVVELRLLALTTAGLLAAWGSLPTSVPAAAPASTSSASGTAGATTLRTEKTSDKPNDSTAKDATKDSAKEPAKNGKNIRPLAGFTPEREAAAVTFVRTHHPELADLLDRLKVRQPHEYQKAIRDLFRVSERLAVSREELPARYELELKQWKLTSRIHVLTARLSMGRTPEQEQELKQLLADQYAAHRELVTLNLDRAKGRVAVLSRELDDLDSRKEAILDAKFEKAIKLADQRKPAGKSTAAAEKKPEVKSESK